MRVEKGSKVFIYYLSTAENDNGALSCIEISYKLVDGSPEVSFASQDF